ncbi:MAG: hypothetical protein IIA70_00885 [Proteobacteria bacterium]|nr:hypothetical protein [Pseudomonadota bacterium]
MSRKISFTYENSDRVRVLLRLSGGMTSENFEFIAEKMVPGDPPGALNTGVADKGG